MVHIPPRRCTPHPRRNRAGVVGACVWLGVLALGARATPPWPVLQQGHQDVDPLARSLLRQPTDLRAPSAFESVYDLGGGRLARIDGGLYAVFPRSTYTMDAQGVLPTIPPGTIFYIGAPPEAALSGGRVVPGDGPMSRLAARGGPATFASSHATPLRLDRPDSLTASPARVDGRADVRRIADEQIPIDRAPPAAPSMFTSEAERGRIVGSLIEQARRAGVGR